jgi:hypothetical protein
MQKTIKLNKIIPHGSNMRTDNFSSSHAVSSNEVHAMTLNLCSRESESMLRLALRKVFLPFTSCCFESLRAEMCRCCGFCCCCCCFDFIKCIGLGNEISTLSLVVKSFGCWIIVSLYLFFVIFHITRTFFFLQFHIFHDDKEFRDHLFRNVQRCNIKFVFYASLIEAVDYKEK